ncbi:MAG: hypothetical protein Q8M24_25030 [Pseudolabrys sp.]|nr:hypothetical protein [Pseudolabrys sp.]MDP2298715.1 hypothetical protein [Pseudolabrys sp.]
MKKLRKYDKPHVSEKLIEAMVDDVLNTPDQEILDEVREDYGDPHELANRVSEFIGPSLTKRPSLRMRAAADDGRTLASAGNASRPKRPKLLGSLLCSQGNIEIWDDGKCVYVTSPNMLAVGRDITLSLEGRNYPLRLSLRHAGFFEVRNLASADAEEFIVLHLESPERYPVAWI